MNPLRLFHISHDDAITEFIPRPSPSYFEGLHTDCVFAVNQELITNYLLPRDCPRVCYRIGKQTKESDAERFFSNTTAQAVIAIESAWHYKVCSLGVVQYEFDTTNFTLLDENAGYYISSHREYPIGKQLIHNLPLELHTLNIELRIVPKLWQLHDDVVQSSLQFSCIRMRNAQKR